MLIIAKTRDLLLAIILLFAVPAMAALPVIDSQNQPLPTLAPMIERSLPAVVNIVTSTRVSVRNNPLWNDPFFRHFFGLNPEQPQKKQQQSLGSGVIVDAKKGYILTNNHVISDADEISVNLHDGRTLEGSLVGSDPETDVAVIQVESDELTALPLSDSDQLRVGDFVVAMGNPFGLGQTVTSGIVSALGRSGLGIEGYEDFIQTDASINPGNSGGALVNLRGELVGINTAIVSKSGGNVGIGFAIPANMAQEIMNQLIKYGVVKRGSLGVHAQDLTPELAAAFNINSLHGVVVTSVEKGSAADKAGLKTGDVIVQVNDKQVRNATDIRNRIGLLRVGQKVRMEVLRNGNALTLKTTIETPQLTTAQGDEIHRAFKGASLGNYSENGSGSEAVVVLDVKRGSAAASAGLRKGDVISQANRRGVKSLEDLQKAVNGKRQLLLNIHRHNGAFFLLIE